MAMRISGLVSGFDTESIIKQMTSAQSAKRDKVWKAKKSLEYKQEAWKDMNKEINFFFTNTLANTKLTSTYKNDQVKTSDEKIATVSGVSAGDNQKLIVKQVATNTFLTGGQVERSYPIGINSKITVSFAGVTKDIDITSDMSVGQVAKKLSEVGLEANFDEKNRRLFLASKRTGLKSDFSIEGNEDILEVLGLGSTAFKSVGQDALINLNGVDFESDTNNFQINELNITAQNVGSVLINKQSDNRIFDTIKDFVDKYNALIKKIDTAYNTKKTSYEPLTDEERYAISDKQADEWDNLIKSSILSKDSILGDVSRLLKNNMMRSFDINGEKYSLARIGITTGNYFSTPQNERGMLNIDEKQLKQAIADDPDSIVEFFSKLSSKLYDDLSDKMKSTNYNSVYTIYHDKQMKIDLDNYTEKLNKMEKKITEMEDRYYDKFTKMETALAKMQNQTNSLVGLFGMTT